MCAYSDAKQVSAAINLSKQ